MPDSNRLEHILSPISIDDFVDQYREKECLFLGRNDPDHYGDLFRLEDVDHVLETIRSHPKALLTVVPPPDTGRKRQRQAVSELTAKQLYEHFQSGDTLVVNHLQEFWPSMKRLTMDLASRLCCGVNVNLYITPADTQGFPVHVDDHDVFVLQVDGAKDWYLYESEESLPMEMAKLRPNVIVYPGEWNEDEMQLANKHTVSKGDFLYVPRGVPHKAVATPGWPSLHLTVSLHPTTWMEALCTAAELVSLEDIDFRRGIAPAFFFDPEAKEAMVEQFRTLLDRLAEKADFDQVRQVLARDRFEEPALPPDGHFAQLLRLTELDGESALERRVGLVPTVDANEQVARILFARNVVQGPPAIEAMLRYVAAHPRFRVSDLPGPLSEKSKLVLVRRLIKEGLLRRIASDEAQTAPREAAGSGA